MSSEFGAVFKHLCNEFLTLFVASAREGNKTPQVSVLIFADARNKALIKKTSILHRLYFWCTGR
jgi:hypothetical protein